MEKYKNQSAEYWVYDKEIAWRGVRFFVLIPIPLLVPIGYNHTIIEFQEGEAISEVTESDHSASFECAPSEADWVEHCR